MYTETSRPENESETHEKWKYFFDDGRNFKLIIHEDVRYEGHFAKDFRENIFGSREKAGENNYSLIKRIRQKFVGKEDFDIYTVSFEKDFGVISKGGGVMMNPVELLKYNKQLILNGAPGTGKTYSARNEIVRGLLGDDADFSLQVDMVQFHPSYDYPDFIEGIRPMMSDNDEVGYTLKNGSFKKFYRKAGVVERIIAAEQPLSKKTIQNFLKGEDSEIIDFWTVWLNSNYDKESLFLFNNGDDNTEQTIESRLEGIEKILPPFLFIIDEINRTEISKVLGEIMYCFDADYRGEKGAITTQNSALAKGDNYYVEPENDKFFIPSNVHIIGTVNDIGLTGASRCLILL